MSVIIGIDPGNTGAIAVLDYKKLVAVHDMPLMANGKKSQVNPAALRNILVQYAGMSLERGDYPLVKVEKVASMPGQGVASMFNFGMGFGVIQGVLAGLSLPMELVIPQRWKKAAGLIGKDKDCARTLAQQLFPQAELSRKKDIGRADAILIALYG